MGGFGMILGGALAGVGSGLAEKGKLDLAQRHQMALDAARSKQRVDENTQNNKQLADREAANDQRDLNADLTKMSKNQQFTAETGAASARAQQQRDQADRDFQLKKMRLESALRIAEQTENAKLQEQIKSGEVQDFVQDSQTGQYFAFYKNGSVKPVDGVKIAPPPPKANSGGSGGLLDYGSGTGGAKPGNRPPLSAFDN